MSLKLDINAVLKIPKQICYEILMNMDIFNKIIWKMSKVTIFDITIRTFTN